MRKIPSSFQVIDFETTDIDAKNCEPVEIAIAKVRDWRVVGSWGTRCLPVREIDPRASAVHGITADQLRKAPAVGLAINDLLAELDDDLPIVAHNGDRFDRIIFDRLTGGTHHEWIDTLPLCRELFPGGRHGLQEMMERLGAPVDSAGAHTAQVDCETLIDLVRLLAVAQTSAEDRATALAKNPPPAALADLTPRQVLAQASVDKHAATLQGWIDKARALPCETDDDEARVHRAVAEFRKLAKAIEKERTDITGDIGREKREIEALYRQALLSPIDAAIAELIALAQPRAQARAEAAAAEATRVRREAEALAEAERQRAMAAAQPAQQAALAASLAGDATAAAAAAAATERVTVAANDAADRAYQDTIDAAAKVAPPAVRTAATTAKTTVDWEVEVVTPYLVPPRYLVPDVAKILADVRAAGGDIQIPGVVIKVKAGLVIRGK